MSYYSKNRLINLIYKDQIETFSAKDHLLYGSSYKGLFNMSLAELIEEYEFFCAEDCSLLLEAKAELAIEEMLRSSQQEEQ
jgi:hypothetical protein